MRRAAPAPTDPDEAYKRSSALLLNNPYVDPVAIQKLTGKSVALGIAGNRFFNPFVWEKVYYFRLTYDDSGRVSRAQELSGPKGTPGDLSLEFEWSGTQLNAIRGYQSKAKTYERTMQYQDGKLIGEEVQGPVSPLALSTLTMETGWYRLKPRPIRPWITAAARWPSWATRRPLR